MAGKPLSDNEMSSTPDDFDTMYKSTAPLVYRFMFWRTRDQMVAEDLTGSVFEKAWRTRKSFTGGSPKAWLFRIARTTLIDYWRRSKEVSDEAVIAEAVSDAPELGESLDRRLTAAWLRQAVAKLPREMRQVVELRFIEGLSVRDVARELGITEANVRVIQYRALRKLRSYLQ